MISGFSSRFPAVFPDLRQFLGQNGADLSNVFFRGARETPGRVTKSWDSCKTLLNTFRTVKEKFRRNSGSC